MKISHKRKKKTILLVEDNTPLAEIILKTMTELGYDVHSASRADQALEFLEKNKYDVLLCDMYIPFNATGAEDHKHGKNVIESCSKSSPKTAIFAMSTGSSHDQNDLYPEKEYLADDPVPKPRPKDNEELFSPFAECIAARIETILPKWKYDLANAKRKKNNKWEDPFPEIIGECEYMREVKNRIKIVAPTPLPVLICGESGTGKEVVARTLHRASNRTGNFIAVNCGAIPDGLFESELFGYVKGAFTDAKKDKPGKFQAAKGGTLFLDEISELPKHMQVKMLRVLEEYKISPVGSEEEIPVDIKLVCATNQDIDKLTEEGSLRSDLYYRINRFKIQLPELKQRGDDIKLLVEHFVLKTSTMYNLSPPKIENDALNLLKKNVWKGNVRELKTQIENAVILNKGEKTISKYSFPDLLKTESKQSGGTLKEKEQTLKAETVKQALREHNGNISAIARAMGVNRSTIHRIITKNKINPNNYRK